MLSPELGPGLKSAHGLDPGSGGQRASWSGDIIVLPTSRVAGFAKSLSHKVNKRGVAGVVMV